MPELPALPFATPKRRDRETRQSPRPRLSGPGPGAQARRLGSSLQRLTDAFQAGRLSAEADPDGLEPEQIIVMEIAGEIKDFVKAVNRVSGLEFLAEELLDKVDPDEFSVEDSRGRKRGYRRQLLLVASDRVAWQQILTLWQSFQREEALPHGLTKFRDLFEWLRELRPWDDHDRLERAGAIEAWQNELAGLDRELVEFEAELWLRGDTGRRAGAVRALREDLEEAGGELVAETVHEGIGYHGVLGRVPANLLREASENREVKWLRTEAVRFFHASGQIAAVGEDAETSQIESSDTPEPDGQRPRIALLDGVPLAGHVALAGRLVLDDPEDWESVTPVDRRVHGTGMASVILRGDLSDDNSPLEGSLYVRPVLKVDAPDWVVGPREEFPRNRLQVDVVHEAVARIFEDEAAPDVRAIVLAVGDSVWHDPLKSVRPL